MRSNNDLNINDNVLLTIKSSSSKYNDRSGDNRGRCVEKSYDKCGKNDENCGKDVKKLNSYQAEKKADVLISIFNAPNCREFFLKCVYHLTEQELARAIDCATRPYVASPIRYFNKTCKQMMIKRGI